jgi:hypothetical protein
MELNRQQQMAEDQALKLLNTGRFDSDTVRHAMERDREWWNIFEEMLLNDPCAAGIKLKQAVYEQLVKEQLE